MERILKNTQATISVVYEVDGVPTNPTPNTATVTITSGDGTIIVNAAAATVGTTGKFSHTLTAAQTLLLDTLTAAWTSSLGTLTTTTEIAGGFLFTISQARALAPLNNATTYPTQAIIDTRTLVESALEHACDVAFVPRYARHKVRASSSTDMTLLNTPRVTAIRSATEITDDPYLGPGYYMVAYEHGHPYPPPRVSEAALLWAKNHLVKGPIDDRTTAFSSEDGTFTLATPGMRGSWVGIPEVDAVIAQYAIRVYIS